MLLSSRHWSLKRNVGKGGQGMAFSERLPERRLRQFTGTVGRRGSARKAAARWRQNHTGEGEHLSRAQGRVKGRQQQLRIPEQRTEGQDMESQAQVRL